MSGKTNSSYICRDTQLLDFSLCMDRKEYTKGNKHTKFKTRHKQQHIGALLTGGNGPFISHIFAKTTTHKCTSDKKKHDFIVCTFWSKTDCYKTIVLKRNHVEWLCSLLYSVLDWQTFPNTGLIGLHFNHFDVCIHP